MGDVNAQVKDGMLGRSDSASGRGVHVKVGVSSVTSEAPITIKGTMSPEEIKGLLGDCPLADACITSAEWGATDMRVVPVASTTDGTVGTITHTGTGAGTFAITGKPNNNFNIVVEVVTAGENNEAEFKYSLNGGESFSDEIVVPLAGEYTIPLTGLKLTFTEANNSDSWKAGDKYVAVCTAPSASNANILEGIRSLINYKSTFEFVHVVGTTTSALWASVASLANQFMTTYKRSLMFICEARNAGTSETTAAYAAAMLQEAKGVTNYEVQVVASWSEYVRYDGVAVPVNNAALIAGLYAQAKESQSIGEVQSFPISEGKINKLLPEGIDDYVEQLDAARYLTLRTYNGINGYYVSNAKMMCPAGSDYKYAEDVRVSNRLVRDVRTAALTKLQIEIDPENIEADIAKLEEYLNTPVETAAKTDKIISSGRLTIDRENLNILVDEELTATISYVPMGHVRIINLVFQVRNPISAS